jgi:hypothetical protein
MIIRKTIAHIKNRFFYKKKRVALSPMHNRQFDLLGQQALTSNVRFTLDRKNMQVYHQDATAETNFDRHYIYHPAWAARIVAKTQPVVHFDISSTLHFCSILSAFVPVKFYDYRPAALELSNLTSESADLTALPFDDASIASMSCMHTVEHIGLGRYGDPIDYDGDLKAMKELARVLAKKGNLLFVVPVGNESVIHFNGHRVYHPEAINSVFREAGLQLKEFVWIPEQAKDGGLVVNPPIERLAEETYACGCFWYTKD